MTADARTNVRVGGATLQLISVIIKFCLQHVHKRVDEMFMHDCKRLQLIRGHASDRSRMFGKRKRT